MNTTNKNINNDINDDASIKTLRQRVEQDPQNVDNVLALAERYRVVGKHKDALELCESMMKTHAREYGFLIAFANALYTHGEVRKARTVFKRLGELKPNRIEAWNNLGVLELAARNFKEAYEAFDNVLKIDPRNAFALCSIGNCYAEQGDNAVAASYFERSVDVKDDFTDAWYNLGNAYIALGRFESAKDALKKAVTLEPTFGSAHKNLGFAHEQLGEYQDAIERYSAAASMNKGDAGVQANMANVYVRMGQHVRALECGKRAVRLAPGEHASWNALRNAAMKLGDGNNYYRAVTALITSISDEDLAQSIRDLREMRFTEEAEDLLQYTVKIKRNCGVEIDALPFAESYAPTLRADEINRHLYKDKARNQKPARGHK